MNDNDSTVDGGAAKDRSTDSGSSSERPNDYIEGICSDESREMTRNDATTSNDDESDDDDETGVLREAVYRFDEYVFSNRWFYYLVSATTGYGAISTAAGISNEATAAVMVAYASATLFAMAVTQRGSKTLRQIDDQRERIHGGDDA